MFQIWFLKPNSERSRPCANLNLACPDRLGFSIFKSPNARPINIFFNSTDNLDSNRSCLVKRRILIVEVFDVFISPLPCCGRSIFLSRFSSGKKVLGTFHEYEILVDGPGEKFL
jgi:hypothetical protein